jgi:ssRNA-specific RNase YbeY (16S rRNA maturation enzyme)
MNLYTDTISVVRKTKGKLPSLPFVDMAHAILGKKFELSLVFIGDTESRFLNNTYRQKDYPTNVLSFPILPNLAKIDKNFS